MSDYMTGDRRHESAWQLTSGSVQRILNITNTEQKSNQEAECHDTVGYE